MLGLGNFKVTSDYSMIRKLPNGKYTGTVNLPNNKRKSIGVHMTERQASDTYNSLLIELGVEDINKQSILFGFGSILKEA